MPGERSPEPKLRILHIFRTPVGGLFRHVMDVARGQIALGHQVGIVCDSTTGGERAEAALRALAPSLALGVLRIPMSRKPGPRDLAALSQVRAHVRAQKPDIVHGHGSKGGLFARLPAFFDRNWPVRIYTPHGGTFHFAGNSPRDMLYRRVERLLARRTSLFLMESAYIARRAEQDIGPIRAPVRIVHNGLTDPEFEPVLPDANAADLLYLGEMRMLKGVDTLLLALARLNHEGHRLTAVLVGAGPDEDALHAQAADLGLTQQIAFLPPRPIRDALRKARLMVVPSRGESLPYVVLEAAAAGMPLVATRVGGIPEIFGPRAKRLVPPADPVALADAIKAMRAGDSAADAAAFADFVHVNFAYDSMVQRGLDAYREALRGTRGG